jgi:N6-L-threonylcarbamoyladenine synthase
METSCDETATAVMGLDGALLADLVASQATLHGQFGGVVPELASRRHLDVILPLIDQTLARAGVTLSSLAAIACTAGPGLVGSLLVGVTTARALAFARGIPLVGVNHLEAHLYAHFLPGAATAGFRLPAVCLIVSGGHTDLVLWQDHGRLKVLGRTRDDAAGEAFDKVARLLGLGYPGGPEVDRLAKQGNPHAFSFPRSYLEEGDDFSFSGLKTAVATFLRRSGGSFPPADVAASFQQACAEVLATKLVRAACREGVSGVGICGGVAANSSLRREVAHRARTAGVEAWFPDPAFCTDNAAMVACAAWHALDRSLAWFEPHVDPNLPLGQVGDKIDNLS